MSIRSRWTQWVTRTKDVKQPHSQETMIMPVLTAPIELPDKTTVVVSLAEMAAEVARPEPMISEEDAAVITWPKLEVPGALTPGRPSPAEVETRAYYKWLEAGKPKDTHCMSFWLEAEKELSAC